MKKVVRILLAILMVMCLTFSITACKSECEKGNHDWNEGTVTTPATCTAKGVKTYKCNKCDETKTETIDMIDHTPVDASVAATCTTAGTTGATKCDVCGTTINAGTVVNALTHNVTTWTPCADDATKHEGTCTREGCGTKVTAAHVANSDGTECTLCHATLGGDVTPCTHPNKTHTDTPATCTTAKVEHWTCPDCDWTDDVTVGEPLDHDYTGATWTPCADDNTKHERTCQREGCNHVETASHTPVKVDGTPATCTTAGKEDGSKCSDCDYVITEGATIPALKHDYTDVDWTLSTTDATKHERGCTRCDYVDVQDHTWDTEWANDSTKHWHDCTKCSAIKDEADHDFGDEGRDLTCNVCDEVNPSSEFNYVVVYTLDGERVTNGYVKLADALDAIGAIESVHSATISVRGDGEGKTLNGLGVVIPEGHNITIDLNGATYVVASEPVGSTGTETNGFQILKNSTVIIKDGTITSAEGSGVKLLIQNYANLTLDGVTVDGTHLDGTGIKCTLSNNCGTVVIKNKSRIIAKTADDVAFDVYYNMGGSYPEGVNVSVDDTCRITGMVAYGSYEANVTDLATKAVLTLPQGTYKFYYTKNITDCTLTGITIDGEALTHKYGEWTTTTEATCTAEGESTRTCATCKKVETKSIDKIAHAWDEGSQTKAASCSEEGVKTFTCTYGCGTTKTESIAKLPHTERTLAAVAATCTDTGLTEGKDCSVCGEVLVAQTETQKIAHNKVAQIKDGDYTNHNMVCSVCGGDITEAAHTYKLSECTVCGYEISDEDAMTVLYALNKGVSASGTYKVTGVVISIDTAYDSGYKNLTMTIQVGTKTVSCYRASAADGFTLDADTIKVGQQVVISGTLQNYNNKQQITSGKIHSAVMPSFAITVEIEEGSTTTLPNEAVSGSEVTFTVSPADGKKVGIVKVNNATVTPNADGEYTFTIRGATTVTVEILDANAAEPETQVFDLATNKGLTVTQGVITVKFEKDSGNTAPTFNGTYRIYAGNTITVDPNGLEIIGIRIAYSSAGNGITESGKELVQVDNVAEWSGSTKEAVVFKISGSSGHYKVTSVSVTYKACPHAETTPVGASNATCFEPATIAHKVCTACGAKLDDEGNKLESIVVEGSEALPHTYKNNENGFITAKAATCSTVGYTVDHFHCDRCEKNYDANDKEITDEIEIAIDNDAHNYVYSALTGDNAGKHQGVCSYNSEHTTEPADHTAAADAWVTDEDNKATKHWQVCTTVGCNAKFNEETHELPCNKCKATADSKSFTVNITVNVDEGSVEKTDVVKGIADGATCMTDTYVEFTVKAVTGYTIKDVTVSLEDAEFIWEESTGECTLIISAEQLGNATSVQITVELEIEKVSKSWKLATNQNLVDGAKIVIASNEYSAIAGTYNSSNYLNRVTVSSFDNNANNETNPFGATAQIFTLEKVGTNWAIKLSDGSYLAYNSSGNKVKTLSATSDTLAQWTIDCATTKTTITNVKSTGYVLQYNANSNQERFSCYGGTQKDIQIYVWC